MFIGIVLFFASVARGIHMEATRDSVPLETFIGLVVVGCVGALLFLIGILLGVAI